MVACPFVLFLLAIVLSVLLRYTDSDYPFGIFKLFFSKQVDIISIIILFWAVSSIYQYVLKRKYKKFKKRKRKKKTYIVTIHVLTWDRHYNVVRLDRLMISKVLCIENQMAMYMWTNNKKDLHRFAFTQKYHILSLQLMTT
jgi:hypothetical protein